MNVERWVIVFLFFFGAAASLYALGVKRELENLQVKKLSELITLCAALKK